MKKTLVQIKNISKGKISVTLQHDKYCRKVGVCTCRKSIPKSVFIGPKATETFETQILQLPEIVAAKNKRQIAIKEVQVEVTEQQLGNANANVSDEQTSQAQTVEAAKTSGERSATKSRRSRSSQGGSKEKS